MKVRPYAVGDFHTDAEREFRFLVDDYGFDVSSGFESHSDVYPTREDIRSANPRIVYDASVRRVVITHHNRGAVEVVVQREFPDVKKANVEAIAREAGATKPESFNGTYDASHETAAVALKSVAAGLKKFGKDWLAAPEES